MKTNSGMEGESNVRKKVFVFISVSFLCIISLLTTVIFWDFNSDWIFSFDMFISSLVLITPLLELREECGSQFMVISEPERVFNFMSWSD